MILSGEWLKSAMRASEADEFPLFSVDRLLIGMKPAAFIEPLIEHALVYGQGSPTRLKKCFMLAEMDEADRVIGERERGNRRERAASPLELMRRYCADRKTTVKRHETIIHGRRVFHIEYFEHKANAKMKFRGEVA